MGESIDKYISFLKDVKRVSENTAVSYKRDLVKMQEYFESQGIKNPEKIKPTNINAYIMYMDKNGCASTSISRSIAAMKSYFHYLLQMGTIKSEPTLLVKGPVIEKKNPTVLSVKEIEVLLEQPYLESGKGIRDRAMLELMYATGIRVSELIDLKMEDINMNLGYIVCHDKNKERIVPFGVPAKKAITNYLEDVRDYFIREEKCEFVFVNCSGKHMSRQGVWKIIKGYGEKAGISPEKITPHVLRHSFAYHLVNNGANIYAVQEMMGHSVVATTQRYENIKGTKIREEYSKNHPRKE